MWNRPVASCCVSWFLTIVSKDSFESEASLFSSSDGAEVCAILCGETSIKKGRLVNALDEMVWFVHFRDKPATFNIVDLIAKVNFPKVHCCTVLCVSHRGVSFSFEKKTLSSGNQVVLPPCESRSQPTNISDRNSSAKEQIIGPRSPCTLHR